MVQNARLLNYPKLTPVTNGCGILYTNTKEETQRLIRLQRFLILSIFHLRAFQSFIDSNEDICLFQDFPHSHLVYPFVFPEKKIECTCTLKWLHLNVGHLRILYHALDDDYFNGENSSNVFYSSNALLLGHTNKRTRPSSHRK